MVISYLDTSAAMKLLVDEPESKPLVTYLRNTARVEDFQVVAGWLLHTELHCAARRRPDVVDIGAAGALLDSVTLVDLTRGDLLTAGSLPGRLRSHDAIHLAVALRVGADAFIGYDLELLHAAGAAGLATQSPR